VKLWEGYFVPLDLAWPSSIWLWASVSILSLLQDVILTWGAALVHRFPSSSRDVVFLVTVKRTILYGCLITRTQLQISSRSRGLCLSSSLVPLLKFTPEQRGWTAQALSIQGFIFANLFKLIVPYPNPRPSSTLKHKGYTVHFSSILDERCWWLVIKNKDASRQRPRDSWMGAHLPNSFLPSQLVTDILFEHSFLSLRMSYCFKLRYSGLHIEGPASPSPS